MLENEFQYYLDEQGELVKKFNGKTVVIVGNEVVGAYDTRTEALDRASEKYAPGTFLVQLCTPGDSAYTLTYHSQNRTNQQKGPDLNRLKDLYRSRR